MAYFFLPVLRFETVLMEEMFFYICNVLFPLAHILRQNHEATRRIHTGFNKSRGSGLPGNSEKRNAREGENGKDI